MTKSTNPSTIREAVGIFFDAVKLKEAIDDLVASGFHREEIGLLAGELTVKQSLGDIYAKTNEYLEDPDAPNIAFVAKESVGDTVHGIVGALFFAGTAVAGGAVVASAAVLGGAFAVAAASVAAIGAIGAAMKALINESDAEYLEQQVDEGHLLLFVRTRDLEHERLATDILSKHSAYDARIHDVPESSAGAG